MFIKSINNEEKMNDAISGTKNLFPLYLPPEQGFQLSTTSWRNKNFKSIKTKFFPRGLFLVSQINVYASFCVRDTLCFLFNYSLRLAYKDRIYNNREKSMELSINCRIGCFFTKQISYVKINLAHSWLTTAQPTI